MIECLVVGSQPTAICINLHMMALPAFDFPLAEHPCPATRPAVRAYIAVRPLYLEQILKAGVIVKDEY